MLRRAARDFASKGWRINVGPCQLLTNRGLKADTGIVGVPVDPDARANLKKTLNEVLEKVKGIPEGVYYRESVEELAQMNMAAVNSEMTDEEIEAILEDQLELLINQWKDELKLIPTMIEWQPWDVPADKRIEMTLEEDVPGPPPPEPAHKPPPPSPKTN